MSSETPFDLLLTGGHVVDPANGVDGAANVAIRDNKIAAVGSQVSGPATHTVDCSGLWVVPGLLDIHVHTYITRSSSVGGFGGSVDGDAHFLKEGVTTCVDTARPAARRSLTSARR